MSIDLPHEPLLDFTSGLVHGVGEVLLPFLLWLPRIEFHVAVVHSEDKCIAGREGKETEGEWGCVGKDEAFCNWTKIRRRDPILLHVRLPLPLDFPSVENMFPTLTS